MYVETAACVEIDNIHEISCHISIDKGVGSDSGAVVLADDAANPGATYKYMLSPEQVKRLVESGYHVIWLPGFENLNVLQAARDVIIYN